MWQTYANIWIHFIWTTKERVPLITPSVKYKLYKHIRDIAKKESIVIDILNGTEDHVHCLVSVGSTQTIAGIAKQPKGGSSYLVNKNGSTADYFDWQDGYGAISVSPSNIPNVRQYIKNQEKHHRNTSLTEELAQIKSQIELSTSANISTNQTPTQ